MADITEAVVAGILSNLANPVSAGLPSIDDTRVAEPGPPTGVTKFSGADASGGALAAKIGARVFQRARERREAALKENKARLDEEYRRAQIEHLTRTVQSSAPARDRSISLRDGTVVDGLTAEEQARHMIDLQNDPGEYEWEEQAPGGGKIKVKGKLSDYHNYADRVARENGRREASSRLSTALSSRLQNDQLRWLTAGLSSSPSFTQLTTQAWTEATTDAIAEFEQPQEARNVWGAVEKKQTKFDANNKQHVAVMETLRSKHYQRRLNGAVAAADSSRAPYVEAIRKGALGGAPGSVTTSSSLQEILRSIEAISNGAEPDTFVTR